MKRAFLSFFLVMPFLLNAQDQGLRFDEQSSWSQIKAQAKKENKFIFMDCFATWCGPCKYMTNTIFPQEEVGKFMNDKFISVAVQLDTTDNDNAYVQSWFKDGKEIAKEYGVNVFPTYLIFSPDGEAVHRFVGASPAPEFIERVKKALSPETQYYTLVNKYKSGERNPEFLKQMATAALGSYDMAMAEKAGNDYLNTQTDFYNKETLELIKSLATSSKTRAFEILLANPKKANEILGSGVADEIIVNVAMREEVFKQLPRDGSSPDWEKITSGVKEKYPAQADEVIAKSKVVWYQAVKDWKNFQPAIVYYMNKYGENVSPSQLNSYAWTVFENCSDPDCIKAALQWSKRSFEKEEVPAFMDTYANLLYKSGMKEEAIKWEEKAMNMVPEEEKGDYREALEKMKKGEKTWN